jgi:hypothetical protein
MGDEGKRPVRPRAPRREPVSPEAGRRLVRKPVPVEEPVVTEPVAEPVVAKPVEEAAAGPAAAPVAEPVAPTPTLAGRVLVDNGQPAGDVKLRFYARGFGGTLERVGETVSKDGSYVVEGDGLPDPAHLEVRVVARNGRETKVDLPLDKVFAGEPVTLVVPAGKAPAADTEFKRLTAALAPHLGDATLADAREDAERNDITLLHTATQWDARLIALAANAEKLSAQTGLDAEVTYGLVRTGLPDDPAQLARVTTTGFVNALTKAVESGITDLPADRIAETAATFERYASTARRSLVGAGTVSSYGEMLAATGVNKEQQGRFDQLFTAHTGTIDELWAAVRAEGLPADRLRLTARLGYLTLDNAPLVQHLADEIGADAPLEDALVGAGLYQPAAWEARLRAVAPDAASLAKLIPPAYEGDTTAERLEAYTTDLAFKVRRSYPTRVVSQMIRGDELDVQRAADVANADVATVLDRAAGAGFSLGRTPVNQFFNANPGIFDGVGDTEQVKSALKTVQRLYQLTPSDEAMTALLHNGFTSAHDIASMSEAKFVGKYAHLFPSAREAILTWRKAQQVTTVTYTFLGAVKQAASAPVVAAASPPAVQVDEARNELIRQFPTLESLFGSVDYCECDHCRSVLSPAAYLVDVLRFLDPDPRRWSDDLADWRATHGDAPYPFLTHDEWDAAGRPTATTPYECLRERRPDLMALPLTCENTNTVLPYIDVVNEILEYFLLHDALGAAVAYDTGDADGADLVAEPRHVLPAAYDVLRDATYPLTLPFDLWLETVRRFAAHFDTPFWELLDALRPVDELHDDTGGYGRDAVVHERLGFSPAEVALLAPADARTGWRELYGYDPATVTDAQAVAALTGAKPLSRRLGVTYEELVAIVRTGFVNPRLDTLATLRRLDVSTEDVLRYVGAAGHAAFTTAERAAFEAKIGPDGSAWVTKAAADGDLARILVLADPMAGCGFDGTTLRYADGKAADVMAFVLLNVFVRVWRRLGWSVEATDRALTTFLPVRPDPRKPAAFGAAMRSALLGVGNLAHLADLLGAGKAARELLPALWSPLDDRRYAALFLAGGADGRDPVFDHPLGHYLTHLAGGEYQPFGYDGAAEDVAAGNVGLRAHLAPVQAALQLTADEVALILADTGLTLATAPLSLDVVSTLHRYALLARLLRLRVADLVALKALSGLDPFVAPPPGPVTTDAEDNAYSGTIRFVEVAKRVKDAGFGVAELDYLLRHRYDTVGPYRAAAQPPLALLRTLSAGIERIRAEHAVPADPLTFTDEVLAAKLALVLDPPVVNAFLAMWTGRSPVDDAFFDEQLLRRVVPGVGTVGFLPAGDRATLFTPTPGDQPAEGARRARLATAFLPYLQDRLVRDLVVATVAADVSAEPATVAALLTNPALLDGPDEAGAPLLPAYLRAGERGLTTTGTAPGPRQVSGYVEAPASGAYRFFVRCAQAGTQVELRLDHLVDPLVHATSTAAEPAPSGSTDLRAGVPYGFVLDYTGPGAVTLLVQGETLPKTAVTSLVTYARDDVERLHRTHLLVAKVTRIADVLGLSDTELRHVLTHGADFAGLDLGELPTRHADDTPARSRPLFDQLLRLVAYARLRTELGAGDDLVDVFLRARRDVPSGTPAATATDALLDDVSARLAAITRRDPGTVRDVVDLVGITATVAGDVASAPALADERGVARVWRVLALAARLGVDPAALRRWADPRPDEAVARDVRDAVKARYDTERWRSVAQPVFDDLRRLRRDALVAHILHTRGFDRVEQLFEFFLIDPATEPVVRTSRLRLAISSVQTFVQRCLLNLEPKVAPTALDADHWTWMKRYRVWEANRKIFLWPENWLEPEFRDDKTHLYTELEAALLASDLDAESAETAFVGYLRGLESISRLDVRSVFLERKPDPASNVLHVVARTFTAPHKYYYRTYVHELWTPWAPVTTEIEGDHVTVAVWRGRPHVFWVTFVEQAEADGGAGGGAKTVDLTVNQLSAMRPKRSVDVQLMWTEYFQGDWLAPSSSGAADPMSASVPAAFDRRNEFVHATLDADGVAFVHLTGSINKSFRLVSKNAPPTVVGGAIAPEAPPYPYDASGRGRYYGSGPAFTASYTETVTTELGTTTYACPVQHPVLDNVPPYSLVVAPTPGQPGDIEARLRALATIDRLTQPFFLADDRHTLFVEPVLTEKTTIEDGDRIILDFGIVDRVYEKPDYWKRVDVAPHFPIDPGTVVKVAPVLPPDFVTDPATVVKFGGRLIDARGGIDVEVAPELVLGGQR